MTENKSQTARAAIDSLCAEDTPEFVSFSSRMPEAALTTTLGKFGQGADDEDILLLVLSQDSGKSGFLFTDQAVYFGEAMGLRSRRFAYEEIVSVARDRRYLRIGVSDEVIEWDLSETLLWERPRKKIADFIVPLLKQILEPTQQPASTATDTPHHAPAESSSSSRTKIDVEVIDPVNWPAVLAFQLPIAVLGIPLVMPLIVAVLGKLGGPDSPFDLNYDEMVMIGATGLVPLMYAYGTNLQFSIGRFIAAIALLGFIAIRVFASGGGLAPISFGGGLIGIAVAAGLGHAGLATYRQIKRPGGRRVAMWVGAVVVLVALSLIVKQYLNIRERRAIWAAEDQARQQVRDEFWAQMRAAIAANNPDIPTTGPCFKGGNLDGRCSLSEGIVFRVGYDYTDSAPCVSLTTGSVFAGDEFFEPLHNNKAPIESELGYEISWSEPSIRRAPNGSSRAGSDGLLRVCLASGSYSDRTDWARQHAWSASRLSDFYSIVTKYHEDFDRLVWQNTDL